jgi:hypothetical protein
MKRGGIQFFSRIGHAVSPIKVEFLSRVLAAIFPFA